jgi:hypothetical protein
MRLRPNRQGGAVVISLACVAGALASAGLAAYGIKLAVSLWRAVPGFDDWSCVQLYRAWSEGTAGFGDFLAPHYEHRIPFTRLLFLIDFHYFRGRLAFAHVTNLVSYAALGATLGWVASRGASQWGERVLLVAAAVAFALAPAQVFE